MNAKRGLTIDSDDDDDADITNYRAKMAKPKAARSQAVLAPCNPKDWVGWECNKQSAKAVKDGWCKSLEVNSVEGLSLMDFAEHLVTLGDVGSKTDLQSLYKDKAGDDAPGRWAKLDLCVGVLAALLKP